jgi:acetolactate synthase-1/2/3 large subunit
VSGRPATLSGSRRAATGPSGATAIVAALAGAGTRVMFGVPGGGPKLDVVGAAAEAGLRFVLTHTETAAAIMAAATADLTGAPGAVLVTRGPGLASTVNGIAHAALDRLPLVVIADTVRAAEAGRVSHQRLDQGALGRSVAKAALTVGGDQASRVAARTVGLALAAPAGPVVALMDDSPPADSAGATDDAHPGRPRPGDAGPRAGDVAPLADGLTPPADDPAAPRDGLAPPAGDLGPLAAALSRARRPVLLLGAHAIAHTAAIRAAVAGRGIPALHTYRARGIVPDSAAEAGGLVAGGTLEWPLLAQADLIIGLGVDEAEMIPAAWDYAATTILVVEWPPGSSGATGYFTGAATLTTPLPAAIDLLARWAPASGAGSGSAALGSRAPDADLGRAPDADLGWVPDADLGWAPDAGRTARRDAARRLVSAGPAPAPGTLTPPQVATVVRAHTPADTIATVDAGAHMLAVMPLWEVNQPGRLLISSGLATMGFALPAAIAAALSVPGPPVLALTGDGGLGMTLAEIETAVRLRLRIVVIVFNDATLSLIKIKQRPAGQGGSEAVDYSPVDFAGAATAMGAAAAAAGTEAQLVTALDAALRREGPTVIDAAVDPACYPAVMELSRGDSGRRDIPGLTEAGGDRNR